MKQLSALILAVCMVLFATACSKENPPPPDSPSQSSSQSQTPEPMGPDGEESASADELAEVLGQPAWQALIDKVGFTPTAAVKHPDGRWLFYDGEFEDPTNLWIYEPAQAETLRELLPADKLPAQTAIKGAVWPDENSDEVLLIVGHRYGTVSPGGDLYRLDLTSKILSPFYHTDSDYAQVVGVTPQGDSLLLDIATFDSNMDHPQSSQTTIPLYTESGAIGSIVGQQPPADALAGAYEGEVQAAQVLKLDDSGEHVVIIPRYRGSTVRVYSVKMAGSDFVNTGWLGAYYDTPDGWSLDLRTILPEGGPAVKVVVSNFGKTGEFLVAYNGRDDSRIRWISEK